MMKVTRSQAIFLSVLGVSIIALVVDRFQDGGPPRVQPIGTMEQAIASKESQLALLPTHGGFHFPDSFQAADGDGVDQRDIFVIPAGFDNIDSDLAIMTERVRRFRSTHSLKAVIDLAGRGTAIIDESLLNAGDSLDGFRLKAIDKSQAIFEDGQTRFELRIQQPSGSI